MITNHIKTVLLLGGLTGLLLFIGAAIGGQQGLLIGLILAGAMNFFSYWFSDKIVLFIYRAKEADKKLYASLYALIKDITKNAELPMPRVFIVTTPQANAFATGRNPKHAAVAVTTGILQLLNEKELRGVLAHEVGHIKNRDILISSVAAMIAGVISYIAMMARWGAIFGGLGGRDEQGRGVNILELLVLSIIAPLMAMIIQMAISRSREYLADETGARFCKDPESLAIALEKIHANVAHHPFQAMGTTEATAHLFIHNPFTAKGLVSLFSTHPPVEERVKRLRALRL
ncbi:MAG TPA: zinc metalloprotease HtpX [Candidatus Nanoarchaeia archaeon]|nr:zinc metalloprotease HtpX [Candidatus Nanoarchaeia archaeon]